MTSLAPQTSEFRSWVRFAPLGIWILFWLGTLVGYAVASLEEFVPWCFPHLEGCTSLSKAGRYGTSFYIYKLTLLPAATLMVCYWVGIHRWFKPWNLTHPWIRRIMVSLGLIGAVLLFAHLTALGFDCGVCRSIRSYGTTGFFLLTFMAQWILAVNLSKRFGRTLPTIGHWVVCVLLTFEVLLLCVIPFVVEETTNIENASSWRASSYLSLAPVLTALLWRRTHDPKQTP